MGRTGQLKFCGDKTYLDGKVLPPQQAKLLLLLMCHRFVTRTMIEDALWPNVDNTFNQSLTNLGFGASARLEVFRNSETFSEPFTVTQGPDHYNAASRFESESLGMDVRDMTFEVRRYFQLTEEDAGVIVSKLEPGEKAAVAGLKPYEIIIAVNDQPVTSVEQFEELITDQTALRFSVKRRDKGRVVKITMN